MRTKILIVGHGYFGGHLSGILTSDTFQISATTRQLAKKSSLDALGIQGIRFDVLDKSATPIAESFHTVVYCVGYDPQQKSSRQEVYCDGLSNLLHKLKIPPTRLIYISSTGVYGQSEGQWVTENSETVPTREGGKACLGAEQVLRSSELVKKGQTDVAILRLAGIYGPDRIPNRARLEQGKLSMRADGFLNLIHVQDAAHICKLLIQETSTEPRLRLFNVSDGQPPTRKEFYLHLADLLGVLPPEIENPPGSGVQRREGSKKVDNRKLVAETGYQFQYPSYAKGLADIVG